MRKPWQWTGENHWCWKGDEAGATAKRQRAKKTILRLTECKRCGKPAAVRHHRDHDPGNNNEENLQQLCKRCHFIVHGNLQKTNRCTICGEFPKKSKANPRWHNGLTRGRCKKCHAYYIRHGKERPEGTKPRVGELHGNAKLTEQKVREIKTSSEASGTLAKEYGVKRITIWEIRSGRSWKHINV